MKKILVLGAGKSAPYLIHYLLEQAEANDWFVTVGDIDVETARQRVSDHPRGEAVRFDINDAELRATQIRNSHVVVNMLAPSFQQLVAWECVNHGKHMISVSYENSRLRDLEQDALRRDVLLLTEMGLDPGIDHMSAMSLIHQVRDRGGRIKGFTSYGSGIPAPDSISNPFKYVITWNPRNVVMAGNVGAQYLEKGNIKIVPYSRVFSQTWPVEVPGVGTLEAYPNRDSLGYLETFGLEHAETIIRGTLRYPGWSETWSQIVRLGLPNEDMRIPNLHELTYRQVLEMFLPLNLTESTPAAFRTRVAKLLGISPTGSIMEKLDWLGLFSDEKIPCGHCQTAAEMLEELLTRKLPLLQAGRDMVVLQHTLQVEEEDGSRRRLRSTLVAYGERDGFTAMAKTVGLPPGIAVKLLLSGELPQRGCQIPIHPAIYQPILKELEQEGISFVEEELPWED